MYQYTYLLYHDEGCLCSLLPNVASTTRQVLPTVQGITRSAAVPTPTVENND